MNNAIPPLRRESAAIAAAQHYVDHLRTAGRTSPIFTEMRLPDWFDEERFRRGQQLTRRNIYASLTCIMLGMLSILSVPSIRKVIGFTKQSDTAQLTYRRFLATAQHTSKWMTTDLRPGTIGWKSLAMVRKRHVLISRNSDRATTGIISQTDMALVQFSLVGFNLDQPELMGYPYTAEQFDDFTYMWRVFGYMLGMEDEFNLFCASPEENHARLALVQQQIFRPCMAKDDPEFRRLGDTMVSGMAAINPLLSTNSFVYFARMVHGCPGYDGYWEGRDGVHLQAMSWWERWLLWQQMFIHRYLVRWSVTRAMLGLWAIVMFMLAIFLPVPAVLRFGGWKRNFVTVMRGVKAD